MFMGNFCSMFGREEGIPMIDEVDEEVGAAEFGQPAKRSAI